MAYRPLFEGAWHRAINKAHQGPYKLQLPVIILEAIKPMEFLDEKREELAVEEAAQHTS